MYFMLLLLGGLLNPLLPPHATGESVIIVNKATHEVVLYQNNEIVFEAPAAIGRTKELTPEGHFDVKVKAKDPYYRKKDIPGGDPENPLGSRWIGFDARGTDGRIYGIHGTNQPDSIGKSVSAGCIRLNNADVEKLFEMVPVDADLIIVDSEKSRNDLYHSWVEEKLQNQL
ncbi:L,D-transpeptidase catalytic domain [Halobacillus karajensis]|uniref:L,D-transpeptidase YkuD n=1 Tax=Halobacillus karajensis TaxID=195088 RepID=A0A024P683_9BACI|nr:L,D-transpeptidase [Halobacillus karajensis]CDQ17867.1 Putative L,D-transpeptidase YkuD [Halobacillus karajensis]CDQ24273.1 Putative L,D-transpeptidase YkuD [Halobacillus karajensis]CDQ29478.1 Putative L,D-transpeptidase YkuD [Halobacillus karajensis]SEH62535.1 L,D-transpeptidase catalytic domain [Halobacillus karajensis]